MKIFKKKFGVDEDFLLVTSLLYIYIPIVIFLFLWTKIYIAAPVVVAVTFCLYAMISEVRKNRENVFTGEVIIRPNVWIFILLSLVILVFCYYMGWSGDAPQTSDWPKHNAVLRDLINYDWPVYYYLGNRSMLTYYIGQYIIPAFAGKMAGGSFEVAQYVMLFWNYIGIMLTFCWIIVLTRAVSSKRQIACTFMLFFFGGALPVAQIIVTSWFEVGFFHEFDYFRFLNYDSIYLQYRSNITDMRWVFQQCIVPWLSILLFYRYKNYRKHYMVMLLPNMLYATLAFIGSAFMAIFEAISSIVKRIKEKLKVSVIIKEIFSIQNILMLLTFGSVMILYFWGNVFSEKPDNMSFEFQLTSIEFLFTYVVFALCMFGLHGICIYRKYKANATYYIVMGILTVIPLFKMGFWNDWCMSLSIPPLMVLMIMIIRYLFDEVHNAAEGFRRGILVALLAIGALYPIMETTQIIKADDFQEKQECDWYYSLSQFANRDREDANDDLKYNYYSYDLENNIFVNYIARESDEKAGTIR